MFENGKTDTPREEIIDIFFGYILHVNFHPYLYENEYEMKSRTNYDFEDAQGHMRDRFSAEIISFFTIVIHCHSLSLSLSSLLSLI